MQITPARVVAFLTPVFTAASAVGTGWLSRHFPGLPHINSTQLVVLEGAGASAALSAALKFLHGQSQYERAEQAFQHDVHTYGGIIGTVDPGAVQSVEKAVETVATTEVAKVAEAIAPVVPAAPVVAPQPVAVLVPADPAPAAAVPPVA